MIWVVLLILTLVVAALWPNRWLVREGQPYLRRWPIVGGDGLKRAPMWLGNHLVWPPARDKDGKKIWWIPSNSQNLFLHMIVASDGPNVHSHPWNAKALILWGRYLETRKYRLLDTATGKSIWTDVTIRTHGPGSINSIDGSCFHTLTLLSKRVITLCWTSKKHGRGWHFLVGNRVVNASGRGAAAYDEASTVR